MYDVKIDTLEVFVLLGGVPGKYAKIRFFLKVILECSGIVVKKHVMIMIRINSEPKFIVDFEFAITFLISGLVFPK